VQASGHSASNATNVLFAALAWLAFAIAYWTFGPYFGYSPAGNLDPWISVGYFLNFDDLISRYGFPYYVSRIPFILTGLAFYSVLTPHVANFALHTFYLWLACLALYCATARPFGKPAAITTTLAFAFSTYTATSMAWDYPNGAAIAFVLLGLWLALSPPSGMSDRVRWIAVGFLWAIAGTNNLLALLVILPCCLMVLYLAEFSWAESVRRTRLILTGVGLMLLIFGIVSKWLFGRFLFLGPQIGLILHVVSTPDYLSNMWGKGYDWIPTAYCVAALLGICVAAVAALATARRDATTEIARKDAAAVIGLFCLSLGMFAFVEFALQGVVLRVTYTSVYLVAPAYLALAAALGLLMQQWPARERYVVAAVSAIVLIAIPFFATPILAWGARFPLGPWLLQGALVVLVLIVILLPSGAFRRLASVLAVLALVALPSLATNADQRLHWVFRPNESTFDAAVKVSDILRGVTKDRTVRFWFDLGEPHSAKFLSIGSLYLGEWQGMRNLPNWNDSEVRNNLPANTTLVHLTSEPNKLDARQAQMTERGIKFGERRSFPIHASGGTDFFLVLQDILGHSEPAAR
jgi:hypothetical protein